MSVRQNFFALYRYTLNISTLSTVLKRTKADKHFLKPCMSIVYKGQKRTTFVRLGGQKVSGKKEANLLTVKYLGFQLSAFVRLFYLVTYCNTDNYKNICKIQADRLGFLVGTFQQSLK